MDSGLVATYSKRQLCLVLWRTVAAAKSDGATMFDLGRTEENDSGLLAFKNHRLRNRDI